MADDSRFAKNSPVEFRFAANYNKFY